MTFSKADLDAITEAFQGKTDHDLLIHVVAQIEMIGKQLEMGDRRMESIETKQDAYNQQRIKCIEDISGVKIEAVSASRTSSMIYGILTLVVGGIIAFAFTVLAK
jgi:hypothetical protein